MVAMIDRCDSWPHMMGGGSVFFFYMFAKSHNLTDFGSFRSKDNIFCVLVTWSGYMFSEMLKVSGIFVMLEGAKCPEEIRKRHPIEIFEEFQFIFYKYPF